MIKIKVRVKGSLKKPFGKTEIEYSCRPDITIRELLTELEYKEDHFQLIMASVNGELKDHKYIVKEKDQIKQKDDDAILSWLHLEEII